MRLIKIALCTVLVGSTAFAGTPAKAHVKAKTAKKAPPAKKKVGPPPMVSAEHKKALAEKFGGFKFGMTKDEVLGVLKKQIDERYEDKIKATTDIAEQDRYRKDKKSELSRVSSSYISFDAKTSPWDVSIVEGEFAHNTGESMMERWENEGGKNQRRFFFFYDNKLWKMYISLDVSIIPEEKRNFDTFKGVMEGQYGAGQVDAGTISWRAGDFDVRAVDRLKDYGALGLAVEDPSVRKEVDAQREAHKPPAQQHNSIINAVIDKDNKDHPDMKSNDGAVDAVIHAQGGGK
ncbi:MAG: hypothetical protein ABI467_02505 [Kofleriaceae bacterium]